MNTNLLRVRQAFINMISDHVPVQTRVATVLSVKDDTCVVKFVDDDTELHNVKLSAKTGGGYLIRIEPEVNSSVLVTLIGNDQINAFVSLVDEPKRIGFTIGNMDFDMTESGIVMNGGENGGLTITPTLVTELGKTNSYVTTLKTATEAVATALDALVPGISTAFKATMEPKSVGDFSGIENSKVKH